MTPSIAPVLRPTFVALVLALAIVALAEPRTAHAGPVDDVCAPMQRYADAHSARVGFVVLDLTDGSRCSYHAAEVFRTASLYKLIVLAEAHEQVRQGTFSFDESITVRQYRAATATRAEGVDIYVVGAREAARRMIQVSDNATAEALAARLGWSAVGAAPARLGMPNTVVGEAYTTTADDIAYFFAQLHARTLLGPAEDEAMLEVLRGQRIRDRIPWFLPDDVEIAHKTGRLYAYANDAGIVYAPAGPFVLVLLTESDETLGPGYEAIRDLALIAYEGFDDDPDTPAVAAQATSGASTAVTSEESAAPTATPESAETPATPEASAATPEAATPTPSTEDAAESSDTDAGTGSEPSAAEPTGTDDAAADTTETVETTDGEDETASASESDADAPKEAAAVAATATATPTLTVAAAPAPTATATAAPVTSATAAEDTPSPPVRASETREPSPLAAAVIAAVAAVAASIGLFALSLGRGSPADDHAG